MDTHAVDMIVVRLFNRIRDFAKATRELQDPVVFPSSATPPDLPLPP
jgi:hypothetical protein